MIPARSLVVAPRMPDPIKGQMGNPFTNIGDVVADCGSCGWHAMGPRADVGKAWEEHYRVWHGSAREIGVVHLNHPKQ